MADHVELRLAEGIREIYFDRQKKKNALTLAMYTEAAQALRDAAENDDVRVVLLAGKGPHFTAGNDLLDFMQNPPTGEESPVFEFLMALRQCPKPVVVAVEGYAIGIGTTLLIHCDLAWASATARFRMPFVDLGLVPEAGSSVALAAMAGHRRAAELLLLGEFFDATVAHDVGLINGIAEDVIDHARQRCKALAAKPPEALQLTKSLMRRADDEVVGEAMLKEAEIFVERLQSQEFMAAVAAFQG